MDIARYSPKFNVSQKHLINIGDLSREDIYEFLHSAKILKERHHVGEKINKLQGKTIALIFKSVSTRTRITFELGAKQLGGNCIFLPNSELQLNKGETVNDTVAIFEEYGLSAIVLRDFTDAQIQEFVKCSNIPIINGISTLSHPLQVLSDLFTIWETKGRLDKLKIAYVGDGSNVASSLLLGGLKCDMDVSIACPTRFLPSKNTLERCSQYGDFVVTEDVFKAVENADVVYTNTILNAGVTPTQEKIDMMKDYQVNSKIMSYAKPNAVFMHSMPATRGEEVTAEVLDGTQSIVYKQAGNRLHMNKAVLSLLIK